MTEIRLRGSHNMSDVFFSRILEKEIEILNVRDNANLSVVAYTKDESNIRVLCASPLDKPSARVLKNLYDNGWTVIYGNKKHKK